MLASSVCSLSCTCPALVLHLSRTYPLPPAYLLRMQGSAAPSIRQRHGCAKNDCEGPTFPLIADFGRNVQDIPP